MGNGGLQMEMVDYKGKCGLETKMRLEREMWVREGNAISEQ